MTPAEDLQITINSLNHFDVPSEVINNMLDNLNKVVNDVKQPVMHRFLVKFKKLNTTDAAQKEQEVLAENATGAVNSVCAAHDWKIEWHTVEILN